MVEDLRSEVNRVCGGSDGSVDGLFTQVAHPLTSHPLTTHPLTSHPLLTSHPRPIHLVIVITPHRRYVSSPCVSPGPIHHITIDTHIVITYLTSNNLHQ